MSQDFVVSVSSLVSRIKTVLLENLNIENVWISGEVSNLVKHRSGHYYFSLKDETGELSCVMFSSYVRRISFSLEEGMKVLVKGSVSVFEQRGSLQLYVKEMKQDGIGDLYLEFEKRKKRLYQQGYFDENHKKNRPDWIENIGIITAKEGAALQDVVKTIRSRWPDMKMTLYPAYVQGTKAPATIINALRKADMNNHDALLLVRGGGSFEDLFCFNDEELVKTIYALNTYIVSGVGHEIDTTLTDLVSDHRAVTPTAAAQWVSIDFRDVKSKVNTYQQLMIHSMQNRMSIQKNILTTYENNPYLQDPMTFVYDKSLKLDYYTNCFENYRKDISIVVQKADQKQKLLEQSIFSHYNRFNHQFESIHLEDSIRGYLQKQNESFCKNVSLLDAYSPLKILERGYSIALKDNKIIRTVDQIDIEDKISIKVTDGMVDAKVINKEKNNG